MRRFIHVIWVLVLVALILSGCMLTVDEMYRIPKRSDAYNNLQSAIDSAMQGLSYCAPLTGENQQTVQMADLDGDGVQEYILFARSSDDRPLRMLVFAQQGDEFAAINTVECHGSAFDLVEYVDMNGDGGMELVVGRQVSDQVIRSVSVYTFSENELVQLGSMNYTKFLTADLDGDNLAELFILRPGQLDTDNGIAELYTMKTGTLERYNEVGMSQPADKLKRIIVGKMDSGVSGIYVASAVGDKALITDIYAIIDGVLKNVTFSNETGTGVKTMRNYYVYADDIDNDSVVELPHLITMKPLEQMPATDSHQLIRWYAMTPDGSEVDKMYTYHNFVGGWYVKLQSDWAPRVVVMNVGQQYDFYLWDDSYKTTQKLLSVFALTGQNREEQGMTEERFVLHKTDSTVYAAQLDAAAAEYGITPDSVAYSFQLIRHDWKTGET